MITERNYPWGQNSGIENIDFNKLPELLYQGDYQVILIVGPNGVGKGTIVEGLVDRNEGMVQVSRTTTKSIQIINSQYHQVTEHFFFDAINRGDFIEWSKYGQGYYGTTIHDITQSLEKGKRLIIDVDLDGGLILREFFKKLGVEVYDCFVSPIGYEGLKRDDGIKNALIELQRRLAARDREDSMEEFEGRLRNARPTLLRAGEFSYYIANLSNQAEESVKAIEKLIGKGR